MCFYRPKLLILWWNSDLSNPPFTPLLHFVVAFHSLDALLCLLKMVHLQCEVKGTNVHVRWWEKMIQYVVIVAQI